MNYKRTLVLFTSLLILAFLFKPIFEEKELTDFSGKVYDVDTGLSLQRATIYIKNIDQNITTDMNGEFHIRDLEVDQYTIRVEKSGYECVETKIDLNQENMIYIHLENQYAYLFD